MPDLRPPDLPPPELIHACAVAIDGRAVLIAGPPGSGKSDLALRLIDRGAVLVSDDQVRLERDGDALVADAPATIAGQLEVRGVGLATVDHAPAPVALLIELCDLEERLPRPAARALLGVDVPCVALDPRPASAPVKVEWLLSGALELVA